MYKQSLVFQTREEENLGYFSKFLNFISFWKKKDQNYKEELQMYEIANDFQPLGRALANWKKVKARIQKISLITSPRNKNDVRSYSSTMLCAPLKKQPNKWVIIPNGNFNIVWDSIVNLFLLVSFILIPLVLASKLQMFDEVRWLEFTIDVILLGDVIFNFFTAYHSDIYLVTDSKRIALNYLTTYFIFDMVSSFPGFITGESFKQIYFLKIARFSNLKKFLVHIKYILDRFRSFMTFTGAKMIVTLILLIHIMACLWMYLGNISSYGWIESNPDYSTREDWYTYCYIISIYFITTTFTTVGYGEFSPHSNYEILLVMLLELIGLAVFAWVIGNLSQLRGRETVLKIIQQKKQDIQDFLDNLNTALPDIELPIEIFRKTQEYLDVNLNFGITQH